MVRKKRPLSPAFCTALKSLTNYSAAMKSVIRKNLYTCTSTITVTVLIGCCGIFFYPSPKWSKSCAQTMPFEFSVISNGEEITTT